MQIKYKFALAPLYDSIHYATHVHMYIHEDKPIHT